MSTWMMAYNDGIKNTPPNYISIDLNSKSTKEEHPHIYIAKSEEV